MKYYKKSKDEGFIDFFSYTGGGIEGDTKDKGNDSKKVDLHKVSEDDFIPLITEEFKQENQKIKVKVNRNEDIIESIDLECECGNKLRIIIDYKED